MYLYVYLISIDFLDEEGVVLVLEHFSVNFRSPERFFFNSQVLIYYIIQLAFFVNNMSILMVDSK